MNATRLWSNPRQECRLPSCARRALAVYGSAFTATRRSKWNLSFRLRTAAASRARSEYFGDTEKEFSAWEEVYLLISKFRSDLIDKYQDSVHWVKKASVQHEKQRSKKNFIQGVIAGILSSALVSFVVWLLS
jgi:hypothetical protein